MKLSKIAVAVSMTVIASVGVVGCHDSKDRDRDTTSDVTAIDGYLQNAICCVDESGDSSCSDESSLTRTDVNGICTVSDELDGNILIEGDASTTDSDTQGVTGSPVTPGFKLVAPAGSQTVTPFTTIITLQAQLFSTTFEAAAAQLAEQLGLDEGTDFANFDYVAAAAGGDDAAERAAKIAEVVTEAIASNLQALVDAGVANDDPELQLATAINLLVNADNSAGVKGPGEASVFDAIVSIVQDTDLEDLDAINYDDSVVENDAITVIDNLDEDTLTEVLQDVVDETDEQIVEPPPPPPPVTGATGGTGGGGG